MDVGMDTIPSFENSFTKKGDTELCCLVCGLHEHDSFQFEYFANVFDSTSSCSHRKLATCIAEVLLVDINTALSQVICKSCQDLVERADLLEMQLTNIQDELRSLHRKTRWMMESNEPCTIPVSREEPFILPPESHQNAHKLQHIPWRELTLKPPKPEIVGRKRGRHSSLENTAPKIAKLSRNVQKSQSSEDISVTFAVVPNSNKQSQESVNIAKPDVLMNTMNQFHSSLITVTKFDMSQNPVRGKSSMGVKYIKSLEKSSLSFAAPTGTSTRKVKKMRRNKKKEEDFSCSTPALALITSDCESGEKVQDETFACNKNTNTNLSIKEKRVHHVAGYKPMKNKRKVKKLQASSPCPRGGTYAKNSSAVKQVKGKAASSKKPLAGSQWHLPQQYTAESLLSKVTACKLDSDNDMKDLDLLPQNNLGIKRPHLPNEQQEKKIKLELRNSESLCGRHLNKNLFVEEKSSGGDIISEECDAGLQVPASYQIHSCVLQELIIKEEPADTNDIAINNSHIKDCVNLTDVRSNLIDTEDMVGISSDSLSNESFSTGNKSENSHCHDVSNDIVESMCAKMQQMFPYNQAAKCKVVMTPFSCKDLWSSNSENPQPLSAAATKYTENNQVDFFCDICGLDFTTVELLKHHIEVDHFSPNY